MSPTLAVSNDCRNLEQADTAFRTGAHILAPCVGNRHGSYKPFKGGPESQWDLKLLEKLAVQFKGRIPICAHGVSSFTSYLKMILRLLTSLDRRIARQLVPGHRQVRCHQGKHHLLSE